MQKKYLYAHVYCGTIHNRQVTETAQVPITGWMNKENVVMYILKEYYSVIKNKLHHLQESE
jgi:hypothetical protein